MMLDDDLFGAVMLAKELGMSIPEVFAMPYKHVLTWDVAMQRQQVENRNR